MEGRIMVSANRSSVRRKDNNTMTTTLINKLFPAGIALLSIAFVALVLISTVYLPALSVVVGYLAVAVLAAIAANDYKPRRPKTTGNS